MVKCLRQLLASTDYQVLDDRDVLCQLLASLGACHIMYTKDITQRARRALWVLPNGAGEWFISLEVVLFGSKPTLEQRPWLSAQPALEWAI